MIGQTWYTINNAGSANETFNFYLGLAENNTYYAVQLSSINVPTAAEAASAGITLPSGATWSFPVADTNPQWIIPTFTPNSFNTSFSNLLGFNPQTWPVSQTPGSNQSLLSNFTPDLNPVGVVNILCDIALNPYSSNNGQLISFSMADVAFGLNFDRQIAQDTWYLCRSGNIKTFTVRIVDQTLSTPILMNDVGSFNLQLSIQDGPAESRDTKYRLVAR
jgi:hypothetical protein